MCMENKRVYLHGECIIKEIENLPQNIKKEMVEIQL